MDTSLKDDAQMLWEDVCALLQEQGMPPQILAMLHSCEALSFDGEELVVSTSLRFAMRKIEQQAAVIEACLKEAAFCDVKFSLQAANQPAQPVAQTLPAQTPRTQSFEAAPAPQITANPVNTMSAEDYFEATRREKQIFSRTQQSRTDVWTEQLEEPKRKIDPSFIAEMNDIRESKLTFDRFVKGRQNEMALDAAKQVANDSVNSGNPLFIYGKSGLGKTHLLRAIQNYIALNDPSRLCVYRTAAEFVEEYRVAWNDPSATARGDLTRKWQNVDVLIIDDIQNMRNAAGTIHFFFEVFNALKSKGKQIVLAADRSPSQLGLGDTKFDERDTSRMDSGVCLGVEVPDYELKLNLINNFYDNMKKDAEKEMIPNMNGEISLELRKHMAEKAGSNIRVIEGFVQTCIMLASQKERSGESISSSDISRIAQSKWPTGQKIVTCDHIQKVIETFYDVSHNDLIGSKRNKELMECRHVAIWLTREMTDATLADIGQKFGGRSHSTIKHSISQVDDQLKEDRQFYERVNILKETISEAN